MDLIKITDLTRQLGLSSRTLRYYEQMGLIESVCRQKPIDTTICFPFSGCSRLSSCGKCRFP